MIVFFVFTERCLLYYLLDFVFLMTFHLLPSDVTNFASYGSAPKYAKAQQPLTRFSTKQ